MEKVADCQPLGVSTWLAARWRQNNTGALLAYILGNIPSLSFV